MRKLLLVLLLFAFGLEGLHAENVGLSIAQKAAKSFTQNTFAEITRGEDPLLILATPDYFVFAVGKTGFVIISADDRFRPVIGYSDEDPFGDPVSPELSYYLDNLSEGRHAAMRASLTQDEMVREEWDCLLSGAPLPSRNGGISSFYLVQTRWDQGSPYNLLCPPFGAENRSYAGCVATAMSQVMFYWKHPTHGYGNHSYFHQTYGELSADFASTDYNFDIMPLSLFNATEEGIYAVALFMYQCGIAVNMSYSTTGSGAYSQDVPQAVMNYFDYSNRCRYHARDNYSLSEFQAILKDQFDLGWPCYYSGSDPDEGSGHAFVCDGYDDHDMFHFNWGWSGSGNGFYAIDALNVSGYAWNSGQAVITNFVPEMIFSNTAKTPAAFQATSNEDDQFSVSLSWVNPTATIEGKAIEIIDRMELLRDGVVVQSFDSVAPGEAMTCVDVVGLPVVVNYSVHAVVNGVVGRKASFAPIKLGPTCEWTVQMRSDNESGWGSGALTVFNSSGAVEGVFTADGTETTQTATFSQGWLSFQWTAPADSMAVGFDVLDAEGLTVFTYDGPSTLMPERLFYEVVNTCGEKGTEAHPTNLKAQVVDEDVVLNWDGVNDPGYGYNIYRDGFLYSMVADTTSFIDTGAASMLHSYYITAFTKEGESEASNTCTTIAAVEEMCPQNFDYEVLEDGRILFTWEAPENTEELAGYRISRRAEGEEYFTVKNMGAGNTSYNIGKVFEEGKRYQYKIVSIYNHGSVESAPALWARYEDMRYAEINRTHLPSRLMLTESPEQIYLHWESAMMADSYRVYRNDELVAEDLTTTEFFDSIPATRAHCVYYVTGVRNGVESSPSNKVRYGNTSVGENGFADVALYPNPTQGWFTIEAESIREVVVYNLTGQQIQRLQTNDPLVTLNLSGLPSGVYSVRVLTSKGSHLEKLVLMK